MKAERPSAATPTPPVAPASAATGVPAAPPTSQENILETAFERLLGYSPSESDRARLYQVRETLGLGTSDALWLVLIALQYYYALYERFPPLIRAAAGEILVELKTETDALLKNAAADLQTTARNLKGPLMEAAHGAVQEARAQFVAATNSMAHRAARRARLGQFWPWLLGGAVTMALALLMGIGVGVGYGRHEGYAVGYTEGYTLGWNQALAPASAPHPSPSPTQ
jgi:hypothetical protein